MILYMHKLPSMFNTTPCNIALAVNPIPSWTFGPLCVASLSPCPLLLPCVALFFIIGRLFSIFYAAAAYQLHGPLRQFRLPLLAPPTHSAAWEVWNAPLCVCVCSVSAAAMLPLLLLLLLLLSSWVASLISSN